MLKKIDFKINGMHCQSCKVLVETEIDVLQGVNNIEVDHVSGDSWVEFDDELISLEKILKEVKKLGYNASEGQNNVAPKKQKSWQFLYGILIPLIFAILIAGYFLIKSYGGFELLSKLNEGTVSYGIIFLIGILAGFHCVGMCGGLVVAYSASHLKIQEDKKTKSHTPHFQYNLGRLISYSVIGAILGGLGSFFGVNPTFTGAVILLAAIFMILMGLSFIFNWKILEKVKLRTPQFIARFLYNQKHSQKPKGPFVVGLLNGFMPCGPLQAMQLYALASGDMIKGALSMGIYALGTIPLMFIFGVVISKISQKHIKNLIKVSGILVLILGIFMLNRGLTSFGYGMNFRGDGAQENILLNQTGDKQEVKMDLSYYGYQPNVIYIKKGIPVRWVINVKQMSGCTNSIMIESLGIKKDLQYGENIIEFTPPDNVREIKFSCWMRMVWGKFVITDDNAQPTSAIRAVEAKTLPTGGNCNGSCGDSSCGAKTGGGCGCGSR
ncbi:MAG: sulfite exporter TauE/SafE family protein [Patescibacteria group bacterium]